MKVCGRGEGAAGADHSLLQCNAWFSEEVFPLTLHFSPYPYFPTPHSPAPQSKELRQLATSELKAASQQLLALGAVASGGIAWGGLPAALAGALATTPAATTATTQTTATAGPSPSSSRISAADGGGGTAGTAGGGGGAKEGLGEERGLLLALNEERQAVSKNLETLLQQLQYGRNIPAGATTAEGEGSKAATARAALVTRMGMLEPVQQLSVSRVGWMAYGCRAMDLGGWGEWKGMLEGLHSS